MNSDKCPKCVAEASKLCEIPGGYFTCGSGRGIPQSETCKIRQLTNELAALKSRHAKLVEAARRVRGSTESKCDWGYYGLSCLQSEDRELLNQALETEPDNDQKPADQGCPFDEALESEANNG